MSTQEIILKQSFQLFLQYGYKEVSINQIIKACRLSKGAFYHYFQSKDDLYSQVLDRFFFNYLDNSQFVYHQEMNIEEKLYHFINHFVTPYEELLGLTSRNDLILYFRFLFQAAASHSSIKNKVNKHFYKKGYYLSMLIQEEQAKKNISLELNAKIIARQLLSMVLGITILDGIYEAAKIKANLIESMELYVQLLMNQIQNK